MLSKLGCILKNIKIIFAYMNSFKELFKNNVVTACVLGGVMLIAASLVLAGGVKAVGQNNSISVTGTAERMVESDGGKWTFSITKQAEPSQLSYVSNEIRAQQVATSKYLVEKGITEKQITVQPITSNVVCQSQNQVMYDSLGRQQCSGPYTYSITATTIVESEDVELIRDLSLTAQQALSQKGILIQSNQVEFFYNKLADLRVELLEEAGKNAKDRAEAIAKATGDRIGGVRSASQGVFQVTQRNSIEVSDYGSYDTSTIEKKVTAIVRASFEVK